MKKFATWLVRFLVCQGLVTRQDVEAAFQPPVSSKEGKFTPSWYKDPNGVIHFQVKANGWIAGQWKQGFDRRSRWADELLDSLDFHPTPVGTVIKGIVLPGKLFLDDGRGTENIQARATQEHFPDPAVPDIALLLVEAFGVEGIRKMGLVWAVGMHKPIEDSDGTPSLLSVNADDGNNPWLCAFHSEPGLGWNCRHGFVFGGPAQ